MSLRRPLPCQIVAKKTWLEFPRLDAHSYLPPRRHIQGRVLRPQQPPPHPRRIIAVTSRESSLGKIHFTRYPPPSQHPRPRSIILGTAGSSKHIIDCMAQGY